MSDHHLLSCTVRLSPELLPVRRGRKLKRAKWDEFRSHVDADLAGYQEPLLWTPQAIEDSVTLLQSALVRALDKVAPLVTFRPKKKFFDWWNADLQSLKQVTSSAHHAAHRHPQTRAKWDFFYASKRTFKYACAKARKLSWQAFTSEAQTMPLAAKLNRIMRNQTRRQLGSLKKPDGEFTDSITESYNLLMKEHFPDAVSIAGRLNPADPVPMAGRHPYPVLVDQPDWIDDRRVRDALSSFGLDKAPGPDGIKPIVLKNLPDSAINILQRVFAAMIDLHYTPALWRKSEIVFIPKPGKTDYSEIRAYRPISLMSFFFKTLERLVQWRMDETADPFHANQHAFRAGHCTEHALSHMTDLIEKALFKGNVALAVYLDIQGAFDTLSSSAIAKGMREHAVEENLIGWFTQYLQHRVCTVAGHSRPFLVLLGTGQGGVLSSTVWNFVMDSFLREFNTGPVKSLGYADDGSLITVCRRLRTARKYMQSALRKAHAWASRNGLKFSPSKTTVVIYSDYESHLSSPLLLGDHQIQEANQVVYLGVLFDCNLRWAPHIAKKVLAAKRHLMLLRQVVGPTWGPPPHITRWLYTAVVRPAITYGALVWAQYTQGATVRNQLKKAQRVALVMLAPMRQNTPTAGLELIANVVPLHLRILELAVSTYNRIGRPPDGWTGRKGPRLGHLLWLERQAESIPHRDIQDRCVEHIWDRDFTVAIDTGDDDVTLRGIRCYTDGSSMIHSGSGFAIYRRDEPTPLKTGHEYVGDATVFQAELNAISMACSEAASFPDVRVTILCDSQAAIFAINKSCIQSRTVLAAVRALHLLGQTKLVHLQWIKGHNGSPGNDMADHEAKLGAQMFSAGPGPFLPLPRVQVKAISDLLTCRHWTAQWNSTTKYRQTRLFFPSPDPSRSHDLLRNSRKDVGILFRHLSGHCFLQYHRSVINPQIDPSCRLCNSADEESCHIIRDCPALAGLRLQYFGEYYLGDEWEPSHLLDFLKDPEITILEVDTSDDED